jgi:hypothetical protein
MIQSLIQLKRPTGPGWTQVVNHNTRDLDALGYPHNSWIHKATGLFAISAVEVARDPGQPDLGPEYHLSVSLSGQRCSAADALFVLNEFNLLDAKEDNHVPSGRVRNFWRPVADHLSGYECPCVDDEPAIKEDKGDFVWRGVTP